MSEQTLPPAEAWAADPMRGWDGERAAAAGLRRMSMRPGLREYVAELWDRREFIWLIPLGNLRQQHMNTVFGGAWHLLSPLLMSGVYYLVFGVLLEARRNVDNYAIYLVAGILTYRFTQKCIQAGASAVIKNEKLLQNIQFPAAVLPISSTLTEVMAQGAALIVLVGFALATGETFSIVWFLLVPVILMQGLFNYGLAAIAARLTVHFRDTQEILQYILRLGLYLSGVIIGIEAIPSGPEYDWARTVFTLNPAYSFIRMVRGLVMEGQLIGEALLICTVWTVAITTLGFLFFWRYEGRYPNAV